MTTFMWSLIYTLFWSLLFWFGSFICHLVKLLKSRDYLSQFFNKKSFHENRIIINVISFSYSANFWELCEKLPNKSVKFTSKVHVLDFNSSQLSIHKLFNWCFHRLLSTKMSDDFNVFNGTVDRYNGITIDTEIEAIGDEFSDKLKSM